MRRLSGDELAELDPVRRAYRDRADALAVLAAVTEMRATLDVDELAEPGLRTVLYLELQPGIQVAWHIADEDLDLFCAVPWQATDWDGHTKDEARQRMRRFAHRFRPPLPPAVTAAEHDALVARLQREVTG